MNHHNYLIIYKDLLSEDEYLLLSEDEYLIFQKRLDKIKNDKKIREDKYNDDMIKYKNQNALNMFQNKERIRRRKDRLDMIKNDYNINLITF